MQAPKTSSSPSVLVRLGVALAAAVAAHPDAKALAAAVTAHSEAVRKAAGKRDAAREASVVALALRDRADYETDTLVRRIEAEALALSSRDRKVSPYRDLFPKGLTTIVAAPLADEIALVKSLEGRLVEVAELAKNVASLAGVRASLEKAVADHREALRVEAEASAALELAKTDWFRQYRATYGALLAMFGSRAKADSFFVDLRGTRHAPANDGGAAAS